MPIPSASTPVPRLRAAVLGATGAVGQKLVRLLAAHPWFEISALAASERSAGRPYGEVVHWLEPVALPADLARRAVVPVGSDLPCDLAFSGLDATTAAEAEPRLAAAGVPVVSNAGAFRLDPAVPLLVPEVNAEHSALVGHQSWGGGWGMIVTNPNCSVVGLVLALKPLVDAFGLQEVLVTTLQAVSGAGYPGVPSLDILGNVIPTIGGEEAKLESEPRKVFGRLGPAGIEPAGFGLSAQVNRVPVLDGHLLSIAVKLASRVSLAEVAAAFRGFGQPLAGLGLPSAPASPVVFHDSEAAPQPRLHAGLGDGMSVSVGHLRPCGVLDFRFVALVHNTVRGAAGGALLNAELLVRQGLLGRREVAVEPAAAGLATG